MMRVILGVFALGLAACGQGDGRDRGLVVLAAASMQGAIDDLSESWAQEGNDRLVVSTAATPTLARQIEQGVPADIVITADAQWMDWLDAQGLILSESRQDIAANTLVWVGRDPAIALPGTRGALGGKSEGKAARLIAIAEPNSVPAGRYAKLALRDAGLWDQVKAMMIPTENVRSALALAERGEVDLAIVYASDARVAPGLIARPLALPPDVMIRYPVAVLSTSRHPQSRALAAFLASEKAQAAFARHGFAPVR